MANESMPTIRRRFAAQLATSLVLAAIAPGIAAGQDLPQTLTRSYNGSSQTLFRLMAAERGNIVFSPYSIGTAMAMAMAGARGETEREMASVFNHGMTRAQVGKANKAALAILNGYDKSGLPPACPVAMRLRGERCEAQPQPDGTCNFPAGRDGELCVAGPSFAPSAKLLLANALMVGKGNVSADYAAVLRSSYAAEVFRAADLGTVNGWVSRKTEGKIEKILDRMSDVVLINAVYFKSRWATVFDKKLTKGEFFNLSRSRQELVQTMLQRARHVVAAREGYRAIRLPYGVRKLAMVVVLPDQIDGVDEVARRLSMTELSQLLAALRQEPARPVVLSLPRFKAQSSLDLKALFIQAGMKRPFDLASADFSGMTGIPPARMPMAIEQIVHRAVIEVAEESTEAAAATAVGMVVASAPARTFEPLQFRVDRPFLYYIVDDATGAILFQGRVVDPR